MESSSGLSIFNFAQWTFKREENVFHFLRVSKTPSALHQHCDDNFRSWRSLTSFNSLQYIIKIQGKSADRTDLPGLKSSQSYTRTDLVACGENQITAIITFHSGVFSFHLFITRTNRLCDHVSSARKTHKSEIHLAPTWTTQTARPTFNSFRLWQFYISLLLLFSILSFRF